MKYSTWMSGTLAVALLGFAGTGFARDGIERVEPLKAQSGQAAASANQSAKKDQVRNQARKLDQAGSQKADQTRSQKMDRLAARRWTRLAARRWTRHRLVRRKTPVRASLKSKTKLEPRRACVRRSRVRANPALMRFAKSAKVRARPAMPHARAKARAQARVRAQVKAAKRARINENEPWTWLSIAPSVAERVVATRAAAAMAPVVVHNSWSTIVFHLGAAFFLRRPLQPARSGARSLESSKRESRIRLCDPAHRRKPGIGPRNRAPSGHLSPRVRRQWPRPRSRIVAPIAESGAACINGVNIALSLSEPRC